MIWALVIYIALANGAGGYAIVPQLSEADCKSSLEAVSKLDGVVSTQCVEVKNV
jgi:hypothetical protein